MQVVVIGDVHAVPFAYFLQEMNELVRVQRAVMDLTDYLGDHAINSHWEDIWPL